MSPVQYTRARPPITVPSQVINRAKDSCILPQGYRGGEAMFTAGCRLDEIPGAGHFLHHEATDIVAAKILEFFKP